MKYLVKNGKYIYLILGLLTVLGIFFPLIMLNIPLLGNRSIELSLLSLLQNVGDIGGEMLQDAMPQIGESNAMLSGIVGMIIFPIVAYLLAILFMVISIACAFVDKFKIAVKIMLVSALVMGVYVGFAFTRLPTILDRALAGLFEADPFMSMLDISNILSITLGGGYWLTFIPIAVFFVIKCIIDKYKKNVVLE